MIAQKGLELKKNFYLDESHFNDNFFRGLLKDLTDRLAYRTIYNRRNALVVIAEDSISDWIPTVYLKPNRWHYHVIGYYSKNGSGEFKHNGRKSKIKSKDFSNLISQNVVDSVIFMSKKNNWDIFLKYIEEAHIQGKTSHLYNCDSLESFLAYRSGLNKFEKMIKRMFDLFFSSIFLLVLSPLFIIIPILIRATSAGPIIFKQLRVGENGRIFTFYKFRTMIAGAHDKKQLFEHDNIMEGPVFKVRNDPRVTRIGRFLRVSSLDELPQLLNVIKGEMSLVGPRPPLPEEVAKYKNWQRKRISVRPGLTCIWQVSGRSTINSFSKWVNMDIQYINNYSLFLDLYLLLRTIPAVVSRRGAL